MFVGHYAAALAAKAAEPRAPLWSYVAACQLMDIGWGALVMADAEHVRLDPGLPGSTLDLYHMPYTHSLPGALGWALLGYLLGRYLLRVPKAAALWLGFAVFSHWLLDFIVHRPDLALWPGGPKVGLGFWNYPVPEQALEIGLIGLAGAALTAQLKTAGKAAWPVILFMALLIGFQILVLFLPQGEFTPFGFGLTALIAYFLITALAWPVDLKIGSGPQRKAG